MMQISPCQPEIRGLFSGLRYHLALETALGGMSGGPFFADDPKSPRWVFTRTRQRGFLAGSPHDGPAMNRFAELFEPEIFPGMRAEGFSVMILFFTPSEWLEEITLLPAFRKVLPVARQHYTRSITSGLPRVDLPPGFELRAADPSLLADEGLRDLDALREEMCSERASVEEFLQKSFGVVALQGQTLAGWCLSEYNLGGSCEVGIGTQEPFRRRGLATAMGAAFLREAQQRGITHVGWDCFADNAPSVATALRLGFGKTADYTACLVWF